MKLKRFAYRITLCLVGMVSPTLIMLVILCRKSISGFLTEENHSEFT